MARSRKKNKPVKRDKAVSITGLAEAVMLANVGTQAVFNLSAYDFITDGWTTATQGKAYGSGQLSLHEMIYSNFSQAPTLSLASGQSYSSAPSASTTSNLDIITSNIQQNWMPALVKSVAIPVGFKVGKKFLRKPLRMGNKLLKQAGLRGMVKL